MRIEPRELAVPQSRLDQALRKSPLAADSSTRAHRIDSSVHRSASHEQFFDEAVHCGLRFRGGF